MRLIVTDQAAWSVCWSVALSVTVVNPAKAAQPIEMPFGLWARVASRNHVLWYGSRSLHGKRQFRGRKGAAHCKVQGRSAV